MHFIEAADYTEQTYTKIFKFYVCLSFEISIDSKAE